MSSSRVLLAVVTSLLLPLVPLASARAESPVHLALTLHFDAAVATDELASVTSRLGGVIGVGALASVGKVPVSLGFDLSGLLMLPHTERHRVEELPQLTLTTSSQPRAFLGHFVLRAQLPLGNVQPYLEGRIGLKHIRTRVTTELGGNQDSIELDASSKSRATALSGGVGVGIEWVTRAREVVAADGTVSTTQEAGWGFSIHWLPGARVAFSDVEVDETSGPRRAQLRARPRTDLVLVSVGFRGQFF